MPRSLVLRLLLSLLPLGACSAGTQDGGTVPSSSTGGGEMGSGATGGGATGGTAANTGGSELGSGGLVASGGGAATGGGNGTGGLAPLVECETPSIDRLQQWIASGEGPTDPANGTLLVPRDGGGYVAEATFTSNSEWHVLVIWLGNEFGASIDLTGSSGFTLTYSATADFYIQIRPASAWDGGAKWHMPIPSTGGQVVTTTFPFESGAWIQKLGTPPHTFEQALADASGFVPVGNTQNEISFYGLRIDGYEPPCL